MGAVNRNAKSSTAGYKISDLIKLYENEPTVDKISKGTKSLENEFQVYQNAKEELENKSSFFSEKFYQNDVYGFSESVYYILQKLSEKNHNSIFPSFSVILCPSCTALFKESATASFQVKEAKRIEEDDRNDDWGDDEND